MVNKSSIEKEDFVYDGYLKVKSKDGWEFVKEKDCVIAVVHLLDFNEIIVRKEIVPPYRERYPSQEFFLTSLSGTIENGETPIQTIIRELVEEAGIMLNSNFTSYENWGEYFWCKSNSSKASIFYFPLRVNDFIRVEPKGDGSKIEEMSKSVRVDIKYLDSLKPSDLVTALCIEKLKSKI